MELRHLRYFVALAEELHFGRAAARLRLAQPSLSRQIRQLEDEVGVELFDRSDPRHVHLTAAGALFLGGAREILDLAERTVRSASTAAGTETGRLTVAFVPSILQAPQSSLILRRFRELQRSVRLEVLALRTLEQWEALRAGRAQIAFLYHPPQEPRLRASPLWSHAIQLAVPETHRLAAADGVTIEDVARETFVWFDRTLSPAHYDLVRSMFEARGLAMNVTQEATTEEARLAMVASGLGVTLISGGWGGEPPAGVRMREVAGIEQRMQIYAAYDPARLSGAADAFLSLVRSVVSPAMPRGSRTGSKEILDRE